MKKLTVDRKNESDSVDDMDYLFKFSSDKLGKFVTSNIGKPSINTNIYLRNPSDDQDDVDEIDSVRSSSES